LPLIVESPVTVTVEEAAMMPLPSWTDAAHSGKRARQRVRVSVSVRVRVWRGCKGVGA
jgi:hypothetical protein